MIESKHVILFSAGLDSLIAAHLFPQAILLNVNFNGPCSLKEHRTIHQMLELSNTIRDRIAFCNRLNLDHTMLKDGDGTIPNRNALLVLIAALYGTKIILNGTEGDIHLDKDLGFAERITDLLRYMNRSTVSEMAPCHGILPDTGASAVQEDRPTDYYVDIPFYDKGKPDLVHEYMQRGNDVGLLPLAMSCTNANTIGHCGTCRPCLRKFFALAHNKIWCTNWDVDPAANPDVLFGVRKALREGKWTKCVKENEQTGAVLMQFNQ